MANYIWEKAEQFAQMIAAAFDTLETETFGDTLENILSQPGIYGTLNRWKVLNPSWWNIISGQDNRLCSYIISTAQEDYVPAEIPVGQMTIWQYLEHTGVLEPAYPAGVLTIPIEKVVSAIAPIYGLRINDPFWNTQEWYSLRDDIVKWIWTGEQTTPVLWTDRQKSYVESSIMTVFDAWKGSFTSSITSYSGASIPDNMYRSTSTGTYYLKDYFYKVVKSMRYGALFYSSERSGLAGTEYLGVWCRQTGVKSFICSLNPSLYEVVYYSDAPFSCFSEVVYDINNLYNDSTGIADNAGTFNYNGKTVYWCRPFSNDILNDYTTRIIEPDVSSWLVNATNAAPDYTGIHECYPMIAWLLEYQSDIVPGVDGVSQWTGNTVEPSDGAISVPKDATGTPQIYYPLYIPYGTDYNTQDPDLYPDPHADTPPENVDPYIPSTNTPMPTVVPDPSPTVDPQDPSYDPSEPLGDDDIIKIVGYDDSIVTPEITPPTSPTETYPLPSGYTGTSGASGMIHIYRPSPTAFNDFAAWLWVKWSDPVSVPRFWNNPIDGIISAHELYWGGHASGSEFIRSGFLESTVSAPVVDARYDTLDCGSVDVPEYYGNYMDYSPYVKVSAYLPFVGIVELNPDDIVGSQVHIIYNTDAYTGACLAQILCTRGGVTQKLYEFNGNCAVTIPLSGGTQAQIVVGLLNAGTQVINGVAQLLSPSAGGGNIASSIAGAIGDVTGAASTALSAKSSVQHSGTFSSNYGAMGSKKPYLIIRRPILVNATNFNLEYGYPAHKRVTIGACSGYLRVREVNIVSATATDEEKQEIESLLKAGVYVS